ncbi:PAS domain-containing protein [Pandoraea sputorum]|uniref:PAS domain-containing protein n=1 Tax=Pandoraea sputorum TaxID=93222 RepID=UPI001240DCCC
MRKAIAVRAVAGLRVYKDDGLVASPRVTVSHRPAGQPSLWADYATAHDASSNASACQGRRRAGHGGARLTIAHGRRREGACTDQSSGAFAAKGFPMSPSLGSANVSDFFGTVEPGLCAIFADFVHPALVKDEQRRFLYVNAPACALLGRPAHELIGGTDRDFLPDFCLTSKRSASSPPIARFFRAASGASWRHRSRLHKADAAASSRTSVAFRFPIRSRSC